MTVSASVKKRLALQGPLEALYQAASDVVRTGPYSQGVLAVAPLGGDRFAWSIEPQSAFGIDFTGAYITQHVMLPDEIQWDTIEGNMRSRGSYRFEQGNAGVYVLATIATELPLKLPSIMRTPAELFIQHRLLRQIADLFGRIDAEVLAVR